MVVSSPCSKVATTSTPSGKASTRRSTSSAAAIASRRPPPATPATSTRSSRPCARRTRRTGTSSARSGRGTSRAGAPYREQVVGGAWHAAGDRVEAFEYPGLPVPRDQRQRACPPRKRPAERHADHLVELEVRPAELVQDRVGALEGVLGRHRRVPEELLVPRQRAEGAADAIDEPREPHRHPTVVDHADHQASVGFEDARHLADAGL